MLKVATTLGSDLFGLLYPVTCLVCGDRLRDESYICLHCLNYAFEPSNLEQFEAAEGIILPDRVTMQDALWEFDKGGYLQDVLHHLKYSGLAELGRVLGRQLGYKLLHHRWMKPGDDTILLPVPLHPSRQRKRGYNQSALIAEGVAEVTGARPAGENGIVRVKNTPTQTGLSASVRKKNITNAFRIKQEELFYNKDVMIIDDVITTGATILELVSLVEKYSARIGIATIAKA